MRCVVANWKMNLASDEARAFCEDLVGRIAPGAGTEVGIAPPYTLLHLVSDLVRPRGIQVFGQNGHAEAKGAFTGEVSMPMLRDAGCSGVILGHSERRQFFGETDAALAKKIQAAWQWDLLPLLCIGESLAQRDAGQTLEVLKQQLAAVTLAYEPVWAIGTGKTATTAQAQEVHAAIRAILRELGGAVADSIRIQYGGSVKPENAAELLSQPDVDGALVGGASLKAKDFLAIVKGALR
jgi:triosephosphate isomerase